MAENRVRVVTIEPDRCTGCQACRLVCPFGLVRMEGEKAVIDDRTCVGCNLCLEACPTQAISPCEKIRVSEEPDLLI